MTEPWEGSMENSAVVGRSLGRAAIALAVVAGCLGLWLAAGAGAEDRTSVRAGGYGTGTCDSNSQIVDTRITKAPPKKTGKPNAKFEFEGYYCNFPDDEVSQGVFDFECKLDKGKSESCSSPQKYGKLKKGKHRFSVAAQFSSGDGGDPSPAEHSWKITD